MTRSVRDFRVVLFLCGLAGCALLGACTSSTKDPNYGSVRFNMTPGLATLDKRNIDVDRDLALTFNENGRMMAEDFLRAGMYDRPSRLSGYAIPH